MLTINDGNLFGQWTKKREKIENACRKKTSSIKLIKNINGEISVKSKSERKTSYKKKKTEENEEKNFLINNFAEAKFSVFVSSTEKHRSSEWFF